MEEGGNWQGGKFVQEGGKIEKGWGKGFEEALEIGGGIKGQEKIEKL